MKKYTAEELKEILELHKKWLDDEVGGSSADLSSADLSSADLSSANLEGANLYGANLRGADLSGANLYGANLRGADLWGANLRGANLSGANLWGANLYGANLYGANLRGADLWGANLRGADLSGAIGNMTHIKSLQCEKYLITYTFNFLNIGCQSHLIEDWQKFDDDTIKSMDRDALEWWTKWKSIIMQMIEMSPAEETGFKE